MQRILVLDTGNEWGGGTNSLLELLQAHRPRAASTSLPASTTTTRAARARRFRANWRRSASLSSACPSRRQPRWAKLAKELARGLLAWQPRLARRAPYSPSSAPGASGRAPRRSPPCCDSGGYDLLYLNNQPSSNLEGYLAGEIGRRAGGPALPHRRHAQRRRGRRDQSRRPHASFAFRRVWPIRCADQGIDAEKLVVVHNAIDGAQALPAPQPLPGRAARRLVVGTIGQLVKRKSVDRPVARGGKSRRWRHGGTGPDPRSLLFGDGPEKAALRAQAESLGFAGPRAFRRLPAAAAAMARRHGHLRPVLEQGRPAARRSSKPCCWASRSSRHA